MPWSRAYEDVTVTYIHRSKMPSHIYVKHQYKHELELENTWCNIHFNIWVNYKVITGCDTILQGYYITDRRKCKNTKRFTIINSTKGTLVKKQDSRDEQGGWKDGAPDGLPMINTSAPHLWSTTGRIHKLQTLGSGHEDPGEWDTPQRVVWWMPTDVQE